MNSPYRVYRLWLSGRMTTDGAVRLLRKFARSASGHALAMRYLAQVR